MLDDSPLLAALLQYVKEQDRVCPMPVRWTELWESLPGRQRRGAAWEPPPPLIVREWFATPSFAKQERLAEHIRWADAHGALAEVDRFLRGLTESEWAHVGEFLTRPE
ncbi:MAG: hypothetical protein U0599_07080 [Vicinamibacteria bacterium]